MSEMFNLMFECEVCKKIFPVSNEQTPNSLTHKKEYIINNKKIFLTYYDCPYCGKRHFVQIDDENSLQQLTKVKKQFISFAAMRKKDKIISKRQSEDFKKARQNLSVYRTNLMKEFTGKILTDNSGMKYILRFTKI